VQLTESCEDIEWVASFQMSKCSPSLVDALNKSTLPSAVDLRELTNHTVSDIFMNTRRAPRSALQSIAQKIVDRQSASFADYINGKQVENGVNSITMMLESEKENLNRRRQASEQETSTGKYKVARKLSLVTVEFQFSFSDDDVLFSGMESVDDFHCGDVVHHYIVENSVDSAASVDIP